MDLADIYEEAVGLLGSHHLPSPRVQAQSILIHVLRMHRGEWVHSGPASSPSLNEKEKEHFDRLVRSRICLDQIPSLEHLQPFGGLNFRCTRNACVPRADTELLVDLAEKALASTRPGLVYDVGTGVGSIALVLASRLPQHRYRGLDINMGALMTAALNAKSLGLNDLVTWDLDDLMMNQQKPAIAIIANLPYIPSHLLKTNKNELSLEPCSALDGGLDGLALIRRLIGQASALSPCLMLEAGPTHAQQVRILMEEAGYQDVVIEKDFFQADRFILGKCIS